MEPNIKSIAYEEYRKRRPAPTTGVNSVDPLQPPMPQQPPVPAACDALSERIEELSAALGQLNDRLSPASTTPCPESNGLCAGAKLAHGTSEFARRIYDSRDKIDNLIDRVRRITNNLEI